MDLSGVAVGYGLRRVPPEPVGVESQLVSDRAGLQRHVKPSADRVGRGGQADVYRERRRAAGVPQRRRLAVVVHRVTLEVHVRLAGDLADHAGGADVRQIEGVRLGLEQRRVEYPARIVDVVLPLVAAAVFEERPAGQPPAEAPAGVERLVVAGDRSAAAVRVVAADPGVVLEGEPRPAGAAMQARVRVVGAPVRSVVVPGAAADREAAARERRLERLDPDGAEGAGAPRERVRPPDHPQRLQRVRADVAESGIHPGRSGRERPGPVDEDADLLGVQPPHRGIEVDGAAPQGGHPGVVAQRLRQILREAPLHLRRGDDQLGRQLRHRRRDGHLLRERADFERQRHGGAVRIDDDRLLAGREAEQRSGEHVAAGRDVRQGERAGPVGRRRGDETAAARGEDHRHARQREILGVGHRAGDLRPVLRQNAAAAEQGGERERDEHGRGPHGQAPNAPCMHG